MFACMSVRPKFIAMEGKVFVNLKDQMYQLLCVFKPKASVLRLVNYMNFLINDLWNMWVGNFFSNMETRNLTGWKVWLRMVFAME